jgi:hypothetical protein
MTFITHGFRVSVVSDVRERVRYLKIVPDIYLPKKSQHYFDALDEHKIDRYM